MCFRESYEKNSQHKRQIGRCNCYAKKIYNYNVPPSMPPEALWITKNRIDSASDGIDGGTGCNFIFMYLFMYLFGFISLCFSRCSLAWPDHYILLAQICHVVPLAPSNDAPPYTIFDLTHYATFVTHSAFCSSCELIQVILRYEIYVKKCDKKILRRDSSSRILILFISSL